MQVSRRDFVRLTASAGAGTAIGGMVGLGVTLAPAAARAQELRIKDAKTTPSICPFCSVGCATLIHTVNGKIVNIEGDLRSPHNEGTLCPKGAAIYQLRMNPNRATKVLHRKPGASDWEVVELEWAMDRVAELTKKTRDETFIEKLPNGKLVNMSPAVLNSVARPWTTSSTTCARSFGAGWGSSPSRIRPGYDTALASPVWGHGSDAARQPCIRATSSTPTASWSWARTWRSATRWRSAGP